MYCKPFFCFKTEEQEGPPQIIVIDIFVQKDQRMTFVFKQREHQKLFESSFGFLPILLDAGPIELSR